MINEEKAKIQQEAFNALEANNFNGIVILPTGLFVKTKYFPYIC